MNIINNRRLLWDLTKKDFKQRYVGSYLGILWAFIQPTITVIIFWFVFDVGFKVQPTSTGVPFILWLVCGMFPWFFFSDALSSATNSVVANSYLVKKVVFEVRLLPIVQILAAFIVSLFFNCMLFVLFALYGYMPNFYNLQIIYYFFCVICLVLGLSWISSALCVFSRDISQLVGMCLQFLFWGTPIFWDIHLMPAKVQFFLKLNPCYYIISGYRDSFIYQHWIWERSEITLYFWCVTIIIMVVGAWLFKKLRPQFADIL
jgi:lipopolysaccharide transport system permease protein/teichoic acid transport system permease protein